jgi:predicted DNA-binding transcriptional regulator AlpA
MRKDEQRRPYSPDFVSAATLAYRLDCSERKVADYVRAGFLPKPVNIGNLVRWLWSEVLEHVKAQNALTLAEGVSGINSDEDEYSRDIAEAQEKAKKAARKKAYGRVA